jgi:LAGLIDADG DNA endonuclease family protein
LFLDLGVKMTKKEELAWAAGLIDGEGCIGIDFKRKPKEYRHPSYRLRLRVNMTHKETMVRLRDIFKVGTIRLRIPKIKRYKKQYVWSTGGNPARKILVSLLPFLCTKLKDAKLGIEFRDFMNSVVIPGCGAYPLKVIKKQHDYYLKMRKKHV